MAAHLTVRHARPTITTEEIIVTDPASPVPTAAECLAEAADLLREARKSLRNPADTNRFANAERCVDEAAVWARLAEVLMASPSRSWGPQDALGAASVAAATAPTAKTAQPHGTYKERFDDIMRRGGYPENQARILALPDPPGGKCLECSHDTAGHSMRGCGVGCPCASPFGRTLQPPAEAATAPRAVSGYELRVAQLVRQGVPEDEARIKEMPEPKGYACPVCGHLTGNHRMHGCDVCGCECVAPFGRVLPGDPAPSV
jgi:hypothetical protein